jgi:hypothetical protein
MLKKLLIITGCIVGIATILYIGVVIHTILFDETGTA